MAYERSVGFASIAIAVVCGRCVLHRLGSTTYKHPCLNSGRSISGILARPLPNVSFCCLSLAQPTIEGSPLPTSPLLLSLPKEYILRFIRRVRCCVCLYCFASLQNSVHTRLMHPCIFMNALLALRPCKALGRSFHASLHCLPRPPLHQTPPTPHYPHHKRPGNDFPIAARSYY